MVKYTLLDGMILASKWEKKAKTEFGFHGNHQQQSMLCSNLQLGKAHASLFVLLNTIIVVLTSRKSGFFKQTNNVVWTRGISKTYPMENLYLSVTGNGTKVFFFFNLGAAINVLKKYRDEENCVFYKYFYFPPKKQNNSGCIQLAS